MQSTLLKDEPMTTELVERPATTSLTLERLGLLITDRENMTPEMLHGYIDVFERMATIQAAEEFGRAMAAFQAKCPRIEKTRSIDLGGGKGPKYASAEDIDEKVRPLYTAEGLSVTYDSEMTDDNRIKAICEVSKGRHSKKSSVTFPVPAQMRVNDTQKMSAALTYAKRAALCDALNIVVCDEDTDGNGLAQTITEDQIATLNEWIETANADLPRFLKAFDIKSLTEMPVARFDDAIKMLKRKAGK